MSNEIPTRRLAKATLERAQALWEMNNRELALKDFQEAFTTAPDLAGIPYSQAVHQMGAEKQVVNDLEGAMADFQLARDLATEGDWRVQVEASILALDLILHPPKSEHSIITPSVCLQCGKETLPGWKFCPYCNTDLQIKPPDAPTRCFNCGEQLELGWKYCPFCTTSLEPRTHVEAVKGIEVLQSRPETEKQLLAQRLAPQAASKEAEKILAGQQEANRKVAQRNMAIGGITCIIGIIITASTYQTAQREGGTYYIMYGAIIFGALQFLLGVTQTATLKRPTPDYLSESEMLARAGNFFQAEQVLEEAIVHEPLSSSAIAGNPDDKPPRGYALLLQLATESGKQTLTLKYYERMIKLNPLMSENAKKLRGK